MGWIGSTSEALNYLRTVGADRDEAGRFLIRRAGVVSFMGAGEELVIDDAAQYRTAGEHWHNLAAGLAGTSYGLAITVI